MTAPCKGCPDRHEACHDHCERYQAYKAERESIRQEKMIEGDTWRYQWDRESREWFMKRKRRGL